MNRNSQIIRLGALAVWLIFQSCAVTTGLQREPTAVTYTEIGRRRTALDMIPRLSAQVNIALRTSAGSWGIAAEIEYRTTDTLFVQLFDPLGRKLAHLEFCGQDYAILAQRSGQFYSGKELPEEVIGFKLPPLDAEDCRLLLLGLIGRKDGMKATVYRNTARPMTMLVGNGENVWTVIYRAYEIVDKIPLPTRISISNSLKNVEIEIQVSNFCAGVRKFQA